MPALIPRLERVSNDWLAHLAKTERGFAGVLQPGIRGQVPVRGGAPGPAHHRVRRPLGQWGEEGLALDLLRYHRDAPKGIMEFMVTELMVGGRARGYRWFDLGLVPLAEHERQLPAPLWHLIGRMMYRQSEHFQDSDSHRRFAAALEPVWRPKYRASPGGLKTTASCATWRASLSGARRGAAATQA